jgi:hypothetical protein
LGNSSVNGWTSRGGQSIMFVLNPVEVMKTQMQVMNSTVPVSSLSSSSLHSESANRKYEGTWDWIEGIFKLYYCDQQFPKKHKTWHIVSSLCSLWIACCNQLFLSPRSICAMVESVEAYFVTNSLMVRLCSPWLHSPDVAWKLLLDDSQTLLLMLAQT